MKHLFVSVGEASGDAHAAAVVERIRKRHPEIRIEGIAGPRLADAGCEAIARMEELNVMGLSDVVRALPRIRRLEQRLLAHLKAHRPEAALLVDFPGFHMRLGRKLRALGVPVLQYIAPKLWAWGGWRVRSLRLAQDGLASILPFEPEWFRAHEIEARYVGNPTAYACREGWSRERFLKRIEEQGLGGHRVLGLLPGSRPQEIRQHVPLLAQLLDAMRAKGRDVDAVVPVAPGVAREALRPLEVRGALLLPRTEPGFALRADAAVAVSGTATLELALWDVPTVLVYRTTPVTAFIGRRLLNVHCVGLANLLLGDRMVMPELLQEEANVEAILRHLIPLLEGGAEARRQREAFAGLRDRLGGTDPAVGVAEMLESLARPA